MEQTSSLKILIRKDCSGIPKLKEVIQSDLQQGLLVLRCKFQLVLACSACISGVYKVQF